jgi:hypothetical protein
VQTDYRSFLTKLGVTTTESAQQGTPTQSVRDLITHFFNAHDRATRRQGEGARPWEIGDATHRDALLGRRRLVGDPDSDR